MQSAETQFASRLLPVPGVLADIQPMGADGSTRRKIEVINRASTAERLPPEVKGKVETISYSREAAPLASAREVLPIGRISGGTVR